MKRFRTSVPLLPAIFLILIFLVVNLIVYSPPRSVFIDGDGKGHYAYLPALFIFGTTDFNNYVEQSLEKDQGYDRPHYFVEHEGILVSKYTCGTALLIAPFFLVALILSSVFGITGDGTGILFQYSVAIAALFYLSAGLIFLRKLFRSFYIPEQTGLFFTAAILLATNLFFYAFIQPAMSHVYSFFAISAFGYQLRKYLLLHYRSDLVAAALFLGIILLIRPVNALVVFAVPFFMADPQNRTYILNRGELKSMLYALIALILAVSPQLVLNTLQTGKPVIWNYPGEGFDFSRPETGNFLFSFRKGWFIYTPFMLLLFPALYYLWKRSRKQMTVFLIFTALLVYVLSSWWNWFYGDGFGMRPMVDFYAIFALVIALMFIQLNRVLKIAAVTFILFSTALNLLQTYQFSKGILHADAMDYNSYRYTFLKTDDACINSIGDADESYFGSLDTNPVITAFQDFEMDRPGWIKLKDASDGNAFSGHRLYAFDSTTVFSYGYSLEIPDNLRERNDLYVRFSIQLFEPYPDAAKGSFFVSDIQDPGGHSLYLRNFRLKRIPAEDEGKWNNTSVGFRLPALKADASAIRFYVLNTEGGAFYIDDMKITVSRII